jgi:hypothetical protein
MSSSDLPQRFALIECRVVPAFAATGPGMSIDCWASGGSGVGSRSYWIA